MRVKNKAMYRKINNPHITLASSKLLIKAREFTVDHKNGAKRIKGYSTVMAAEALGKSIIQLRIWISKGYLPKPVLMVKNNNYTVYDARELQIIRKHLFAYTRTGISYITKNSLDFVDALATEVLEYRLTRT